MVSFHTFLIPLIDFILTKKNIKGNTEVCFRRCSLEILPTLCERGAANGLNPKCLLCSSTATSLWIQSGLCVMLCDQFSIPPLRKNCFHLNIHNQKGTCLGTLIFPVHQKAAPCTFFVIRPSADKKPSEWHTYDKYWLLCSLGRW